MHKSLVYSNIIAVYRHKYIIQNDSSKQTITKRFLVIKEVQLQKILNCLLFLKQQTLIVTKLFSVNAVINNYSKTV